MKFERSWTGNWENAFRGLRHPMESYNKSDSSFGIAENDIFLDELADDIVDDYMQNWTDERIDPNEEKIKERLFENGIIRVNPRTDTVVEYAFIGPKDLDLAQRMIKAGTPNDKFLRQIFVSVDITAPLYWWKEMDTYKVATTANSTSTMHKLASTPITLDCFETDDFDYEWFKSTGMEPSCDTWINDNIIYFLEELRQRYLETKDKRYWKELIRWLPESWLQTRTWTANYATLRNIIRWRSDHKLTEWHQFVDWCRALPYAEELLFYDNSIN